MGMRTYAPALFDNFDPRRVNNKFDPRLPVRNGATGTTATAPQSTGVSGTSISQASPGQKMQVNLVLNNQTAVQLYFELFYFLNSAVRILNPAYASGVYQYIPLLTLEGLKAYGNGANTATSGVIGFGQDGHLEIQGDNTVPSPVATIQCKEIGYSSFFEASAITPFKITSLRMTCQTDLQIDETINYISKSFSGGVTDDPVSPRAYFKPTQFQDFIIDIPMEMDINIESGFKTILLAGENVRFALFISFWTEQTLG